MKSILVVEDSEDERLLIKIVLENEGYKVEEAENGKIAIEKFEQNTPDLIVMDLLMPEKEGLETIKEIRKFNKEVKIIAVTGAGLDSQSAYLKMAEFLGADFTIVKPLDMDGFVELVGKALD